MHNYLKKKYWKNQAVPDNWQSGLTASGFGASYSHRIPKIVTGTVFVVKCLTYDFKHFNQISACYQRERDDWGDRGVDGWVILGWISRRWDVGMWTGLSWPRIGTGGGRL